MPHLPGTVDASGVVRLKVQRMRLTPEQFAFLCQENDNLRFELTARQELIIMPPTGSETGQRSGKVFLRIGNWAEADGTGIVFDSSTGFTLPNGAVRSPDASWIQNDRWNMLSQEQKIGFAPICPDFVVELCSPTDRLSELQEKMQEYLDNGARLGWLIDPSDKHVYVYRLGHPVEMIDNPTALSGESVLPGFVLRVQELW